MLAALELFPISDKKKNSIEDEAVFYILGQSFCFIIS
jgi:hypothetical protein